jgi:NAD(P)-dependent dehydrogenase (short-subunit alcohol dehydrogenase family)
MGDWREVQMAGIGSSERTDWPTAVVVGAGGLGMATARRLGLSHRLIVADRDKNHVERQCATLRSDGYDVIASVCDLTCSADIGSLAAMAARRPAVQALANIVGLSPAAKDFDAIMAVNLIGASAIAQAFIEILAPGGSAVFISSSAAHMQAIPPEMELILDDPLRSDFLERLRAFLGSGADANRAYALSKAGLNRMCRRKAADWGKRGLRINSLSPGLIATPQGAESYKHSSGKFALFEAVPLGRECSMLEIAGVVTFLLSDQASYISGTDILVDGGLISSLGTPARAAL